ncbi:MAG: hypothetical protein AB9866_20005 [Syntrophobacteraceae bacterium]
MSRSLAGNPYINIPEEQRRSNELRKQTIGKWTDRQKQLDKAISAEEERYRQQTGQRSIPVTQQNLNILMQRVGANPGEENFCRERMKVYYDVGESLKQGEDFLQDLNEKMRQWGGG